ncbi:hypothetical protein J4E85_002688 [Alternaria conjuncta]|uniref:uncharacterized protein n=1 Tax=Alternaria conjuncta TaxID=181017 RepID=UPI002220BD15|nr:uncharacterized protein J4E85_002688 [Alternaria conjuncta]KAI4934828.1 hypothetical protein J4E85_002688 [Alternaria conjuncta]
MMALESPQPLSRKKSIFRRFSRRERGDAPPSPFLMSEGLRSPHLQSSNLQSPRRLQRRPSHRPLSLLTPPASPTEKSPIVTIDASKPQQPKMVTHIQRIDLPIYQRNRSEFTPPPSPEPRRRILPSALPTMPFPGKPLITSWNVFLPPSQIYSLYLGYAPRDMDDKWYIYSEGPDQAGKLKVHFHRSWTGMKVAELFVVMDTKGEGAGKIVGIKWNGGEEMNWMSEEEAKYMIRTACRWQLAVDLEK